VAPEIEVHQRRNIVRTACSTALLLGLIASTAGAAKITIPLAAPSNLFQPGQPVKLQAKLSGITAESAELVVNDYFGQAVTTQTLPISGDTLSIDLGTLPPGYYDVSLKAGETAAQTSFGVAPFVSRTAAEARNGG